MLCIKDPRFLPTLITLSMKYFILRYPLHLYFIYNSSISPILGEVWSVCWARTGSPQLCFYIGVAFATSSMLWPSVSCHEVWTSIYALIYFFSLLFCGFFLSKWTYAPEKLFCNFPTGTCIFSVDEFKLWFCVQIFSECMWFSLLPLSLIDIPISHYCQLDQFL